MNGAKYVAGRLKDGCGFGDGLTAQIAYTRKHFPAADWEAIAKLDYLQGSRQVVRWLRNTLDREPPSCSVRCLHFTICFPGQSPDIEVVGYDWYHRPGLSSLSYRPTSSYARSRLISRLFKACATLGEKGSMGIFPSISVGFAALALREALLQLGKSAWLGKAEERLICLGYGDGLWMTLARFSKEGLLLRPTYTVLPEPTGPIEARHRAAIRDSVKNAGAVSRIRAHIASVLPLDSHGESGAR